MARAPDKLTLSTKLTLAPPNLNQEFGILVIPLLQFSPFLYVRFSFIQMGNQVAARFKVKRSSALMCSSAKIPSVYAHNSGPPSSYLIHLLIKDASKHQGCAKGLCSSDLGHEKYKFSHEKYKSPPRRALYTSCDVTRILIRQQTCHTFAVKISVFASKNKTKKISFKAVKR